MHSNHLSCQVSTVCHCYLLGGKFQPTNQPAILPLHLLHLDAFIYICFLYICCSDCTGGGNLLQNLSSSDPDDGSMLPWTSGASDPLRNDAVGISDFFPVGSPGFFPVTVNSARCPSCPSCPSCPKNPKYVRTWFPGNLDPGRSHICDKIFWRPCAIPCV